MPHPLSHKYPISISQLCLVNTDVPAGVGAPPLDTIPKTQVYLCEFHREQAWERHTDGTMTLFQTTFVSVPVKSFTAWREKAAVTEDDILMKDLTHLSVDSTALSKQHSLSQPLSSGDVTELGSTSDDNFKSPL